MADPKINILHLQPQLNITCGISKTIYLLVKNISSDFENTVACFGGDGFDRFNEININPKIISPDSHSFIAFPIHFFKILSIVRENRIDIIHSYHRYFDLLSFIISKITKVKTVTSVQSKVYKKNNLSYKADIKITCSKAIKKHLTEHFKISEKRLKVIYNMVEPEEFYLKSNDKQVMNSAVNTNKKFIIGYAGRFDIEEKGIDVLLRAFNLFTETNKDIELIMIGDGRDKNYIDQFAEKYPDQIKLMPADKNLFNFFSQIDVLIVPSRIEPFGIIILESAIMKVPVIASNVDGIPEIIENHKSGLLFSNGNSEELKEQILKLKNNVTLRKHLSDELYKSVISRFIVNKIVPQYESIYLELCN